MNLYRVDREIEREGKMELHTEYFTAPNFKTVVDQFNARSEFDDEAWEIVQIRREVPIAYQLEEA